MDVLIPKDNEKELLEMAERLGEDKVIFLYDLKEYKSKNVDFETTVLVDKGIILKDDKEISRIPKECEFVFAENPTRMRVESRKITHYLGLEDQKKADFIHHRNSGMNQVYAKFMQEKENTYCISYNMLLYSKRKDQLLGRFRQNLKLCKKYEVKAHVFSFARKPYEMRARHERESLYKVL